MLFLTHSQVQRIDYAKITGVGMHAATCNIYWVFGDRKRFYTCFNPGGQNLPYTLFFELQGGCILMNGCDDYKLEERVAMYLEARDRLIEADFALHTDLEAVRTLAHMRLMPDPDAHRLLEPPQQPIDGCDCGCVTRGGRNLFHDE